MHRVFIILPLVIILLWLGSILVFTPRVVIAPSGDFQREAAIVYNIANGNMLGDPYYLGEFAFYPYLSHLLFALVHKVTHISVQTVVGGSPLVLAVPSIILALWSFWGISKSLTFTVAALLGLLFGFPLTRGSYELASHPTTLAVGTFLLAIFLFWRATVKRHTIDWVLAAVGISLVIYSHPVPSVMLCASIAIYQLLTRKAWGNFSIMIGMSFILTSAYLLPILSKYQFIVKNTNPTAFIDPNMQNFSSIRGTLFYGDGITAIINSFFVYSGLIIMFVKRKPLDKIILIAFLTSLFYMLFGLGRTYNILPPWIPIVVPHEFQRFHQVVAVLMFAMGALWWLEISAKKMTHHLTRPVILVMCIMFYSSLTLPQFIHEITAQKVYLASKTLEADWGNASDWVLQNTSLFDVILTDYDRAYFYIGGLTGRKVVASMSSHANPFVDQNQRLIDAQTMFRTSDMVVFSRLASTHHVTYVMTAISSSKETLASHPDLEGFVKFLEDPMFTLAYSSKSVKIFKLRN